MTEFRNGGHFEVFDPHGSNHPKSIVASDVPIPDPVVWEFFPGCRGRFVWTFLGFGDVSIRFDARWCYEIRRRCLGEGGL